MQPQLVTSPGRMQPQLVTSPDSAVNRVLDSLKGVREERVRTRKCKTRCPASTAPTTMRLESMVVRASKFESFKLDGMHSQINASYLASRSLEHLRRLRWTERGLVPAIAISVSAVGAGTRLHTVQMMPRDARSRGGVLMPVPGEGLASRCKMQSDARSGPCI